MKKRWLPEILGVPESAELEKSNAEMATQIECLGEVIIDQQAQIKHLLVIMEKVGSHQDLELPAKVDSRGCYVQTTNIPEITFSSNNADSGYTSETRSDFSQTDKGIEEFRENSKFQDTPKSIISRPPGEDKATICNYHFENIENAYTNTNDYILPSEAIGKDIKQECILAEEKKVVPNVPSQDTALPEKQTPKVSTTSVEVQSVNFEGKSETLKAVLESSSPINGVFEINNSASLSLRLVCNPNGTASNSHSINKPVAAIVSEKEVANGKETSGIRISASVVDEFELMKDSSKESMAVRLPSMHHQVMAVQCLEYTCKKDVIGDESEENYLMGILNRESEDVDVIISRETIPSENFSEMNEDNYRINDQKSECSQDSTVFNADDRRECIQLVKKVVSITDLTVRLKKLTSDLDSTLAKPGGKDSLLTSVKLMYNTLLKDIA